jgi:hypothetical protein
MAEIHTRGPDEWLRCASDNCREIRSAYRQCSANKTWVVTMEMDGSLSIGRFADQRIPWEQGRAVRLKPGL